MSGFNNNDPFSRYSDYQGPSERTDITKMFSERTKEAIQEAAKTAVEYKQINIDSEHLLYALTKDGELMNTIFKELGLNVDDLRSYIESQMETGNVLAVFFREIFNKVIN